MSRATERNYLDDVAIADRRYNSTLNNEDETPAEKATMASTAVTNTTQGITARVVSSLNEDYVILKLYKNGKKLATYKSRDYDESDAQAFVEELDDEYIVNGITVTSDLDDLIIGEETAQLEVLTTEIDGDTDDVTGDSTFESSDTDLATVDENGVVTPVVTGISYATQTLTVTGQPANNETVTIAGRTYTFKTTLTASTTANEVLRGASAAASLDNLKSAINLTGTPGTDYGSDTTIHPTVTATTNTDTTQVVQAKEAGLNGNSLAVSETLAQGSWGATTLAGATTDEVIITATYTAPSGAEHVNVTDPIRIRDVTALSAVATEDELVHPDTDQIVATATFSDNTTADVTDDAEYESDNEAEATVDATGEVTTVGAGSPTITVSYGNETDTVDYTITT